MPFKPVNVAAHLTEFNSAVSSDFLEMYRRALDEKVRSDSLRPKHKTFAPSQMRCDRVSWFRLRGTEPDKPKNVDSTLDFTAEIGTACHEMIQGLVSKALGDRWIQVQDWIDTNPEVFKDYDMTLEKKGYETLIELRKPFPVRFACDGIVRPAETVYLFEIKSSEYASWNELTGPKPKHIDQVKTYSMLLGISDVLFMYIDRLYGGVKCFEVHFDSLDHYNLKERMTNVMNLVEANIAPEGLPLGDPDCSSSMCPYYEKCKEWGRY